MPINNYKPIVLGFVSTILVFFALSFLADRYHSALPCLPFEKRTVAPKDYIRFEKLSARFWSSLCTSPVKPIVISSSEGKGPVAFSALLTDGPEWNEIKGAHRGVKSLAYLFAHTINPERAKNLKMVALINPVYFNFAASTNASALQQTAISSLSYYSLVPILKWKWDEYLLSSPWITLKEYYLEWFSPRHLIAPPPRREFAKLVPMPDAIYDSSRQMIKYRLKTWKGMRGDYNSKVEPTHSMMLEIAAGLKRNPEMKACFVLLPINTANTNYFQRGPDQIMKELRALMTELFPADKWIDLSYMSTQPKIFVDAAHFTNYGTGQISHAIKASQCFKDIL